MTFTGGTSLVLSILEILLIDTGFLKNSLREGSVDSLLQLGYRGQRHYRPSSGKSKAIMSISIAEAVLEASKILRKAGVPEARREAGSLLENVIKKDRTFLISHAEDKLDSHHVGRYRDDVERRAAGEPLQYITGSQDFYGRTIHVTPGVLIPRPETEILVEAALALMTDSFVFCDIGTGSGCIAITLLAERPEARGVALDVSEAAIEIARQNAVNLNVDGRLTFGVSDCFESLTDSLSSFDLIVSNPPYIAGDVINGLQREVRDHEPLIALSPGPDGLAIIRRLIEQAPNFLRKDGYLLLEIGFDQGEAIPGLVDPNIWKLIEVRLDLQEIPRIAILQKLN